MPIQYIIWGLFVHPIGNLMAQVVGITLDWLIWCWVMPILFPSAPSYFTNPSWFIALSVVVVFNVMFRQSYWTASFNKE